MLLESVCIWRKGKRDSDRKRSIIGIEINIELRKIIATDVACVRYHQTLATLALGTVTVAMLLEKLEAKKKC
uniref:Uncharacterized protein n=1 Tax=Tetraselmis sp. GSL018 TaxID=582737 RepID=A0A061QPC0_9CHLO